MKQSGWTWNSRKRDLDAARWWGILPSQFYKLDREDKLDTLALYEISWRVEAINSWEANEESKRKSARRKRG